MKSHKVTWKIWRAAASFRKVNGFVNGGVTNLTAVCGESDPAFITKSWKVTTCKKCLKKRP